MKINVKCIYYIIVLIIHFPRPDAVLTLFQDAVSKCDVIVTSGGVSMGEKVCTSYFLDIFELCVFIANWIKI